MHVNVPTLFVILIIIGIGGFLFNREHSQKSIKDTVTTLISPTPSIINNQVVNLNDKEFAYYLFRLKDPKKLSLYSNLKEASVFDYENTCEFASNGGFYDETSGHIGLFIEKGKLVSPFLHDALFNGVLYSDGTNVRITTSDPGEDLFWAVQSGPILYDQAPKKLRLKTDEEAKRVVVAETKSGEIIVMGITTSENTLSGPTLEELPTVVDLILTKEKLLVSKVLNLDGGLHSFFYTKAIHLREMAKPGSILCVNR